MQFQSVQMLLWSFYLLVKEFALPSTKTVEDTTLVQLHVLFRHGNRTVNGPEELYPKDPYLNETYYPFGLGQLTNVGKVKQYLIGKTLRKRYDAFLGPYAHPDVVEGWTTDYNRTKTSLDLLFAGLFPPYKEEIWSEELLWQPIPYNYYRRNEDKVLIGVNCPYFLQLYDEHIQSTTYQNKIKDNQKVLQYISNSTGLNITKFVDIYNLFFGLATEEEWGFELPAWTKPVWPKTIIDLSIEEYFASTATKEMIQMASGYFLKKVMADTQSKISNNGGKKIYVYSGHENNIGELLLVLGLLEPLHIPDYGAYVVFEIHNIDGKYGIKIYYENYTGDGPRLLKLPECETFCELSKFYSIIEEYIPSEDLCDRNLS